MDTVASFELEALPHFDAVYRFSLRLTGSAADAEDLAQETFLRAYRAWNRYQSGTRAKSWLFTICRNAFLRQRQHDTRRDEIMRQAVLQAAPADVTPVLFVREYPDPEGSFFFSLIDRHILDSIEAVPGEFREVVLLSDLEGLSYAEISDVLDVPLGTVKSRLFRGRRLLQQALYAYACECGYVSSAVERKRIPA